MEVVEAFDAFPDIQKHIIIKSDLLRLGVKFGEAAKANFNKREDILYKGARLFSTDRTRDTFAQKEKIPFVMYLEDGTALGTHLRVRLWEDSPYVVDLVDDTFRLSWNGEPLARVWFQLRPKWYYRKLNGVPMEEICFATGDSVFLVANRYCEYFSMDKQCAYCDLTTFAQELQKEQKVVVRKTAEQAAEVAEIAFHEPGFRHLIISGGTFFGTHRGKTQIEWYSAMCDALRERLKVWYPTVLQIGALDDEGWKRLHGTGVPTVQPNIEVWDKKLFEIICPGKAETMGYDEWIRRTIRAVDFWGVGNVNPNFVSGVEMVYPGGFRTVDEALKSTLSGYDFLMSNGVLPRQGEFLVIEPGSKLGKMPDVEPAPLEYYLRLGKGYLELREKHGFVCPPPVNCRACLPHGTEYDFEYWHGSGPSSRKAELESGVPEGM
jgi:hypothetical protein